MPKEGTLAWFQADLQARREMVKARLDAELTLQERATVEEQLADIEVVLADMRKDPHGYMALFLVERHVALRKATDRFTQ